MQNLTSEISDHLPSFAFIGKLTKHNHKHVSVKYRTINNHVIQNICQQLYNVDWTRMENIDIDLAVDYLDAQINLSLNSFAPEKTKLIHYKNCLHQAWMTPALLKSSKTKDKLFKHCLSKPRNSPSYIKFVQYRNTYNRLKKAMKNKYYTDLLNVYKYDSRKTWSLLNTLTGRNTCTTKSNIPDSFETINNGTISDPLTISNEFCKYFTEVGKAFAAKIPPPTRPFNEYLPRKYNTNFFMFPTDPDEIRRTILSLKPKNSSGHDSLSSKLLKQIAHSICTPISFIVNKSLETGYVPKAWKLAKVIPIFKSKVKSIMSNYRPISLLPSLSKVLEKIVHHRLYKYCNMHDILYNNQYGFRPKHSTINAVTNFVAHILRSIEKNEYTVSVLLDLSKAFDTIDHDILLKKLEIYGVRGLALEWFRSYLKNRTQFVNYKTMNSTCLSMSCGVPQGSVLGPLLFIIYTNDLPNALTNSKCILFADDTTVFKSSSNINDLIDSVESDLLTLNDWFRANKLSLNITKTNFMIFSPKSVNKHPTITTINLGNQVILRVNCAKFLGIYIDDELQWDTHIDNLSCKLSSGAYAINSTKRILSLHNLKQIYYSLFNSHISYGTLLWGSAYKYKLHKIIVAQKKVIRSVHNAPYNASSSILFKNLNIPKLSDLYNIQLGKMMYLFNKNELPSPLLALFTRNTVIHDHNTRNRQGPYVTKRKTKYISQTFLHQCPKIWSGLTPNIKSAPSLKSFSYRMKEWCISKYI